MALLIFLILPYHFILGSASGGRKAIADWHNRSSKRKSIASKGLVLLLIEAKSFLFIWLIFDIYYLFCFELYYRHQYMSKEDSSYGRQELILEAYQLISD